MRHGGYYKRKLDPGLPAVDNVVATVDGTDVTITWDKIAQEDFRYYAIYRGVLADFSDEEIITWESDIHVEEYTDESLSAGTYWYRVKTVNPNDLETPSTGVSATVS